MRWWQQVNNYMKRKKILIVLAVIVIGSNLFPFTALLKIFVDEKHYRYSNYNGSLTFTVFSHRDFEMLKRRHKDCQLSRPNLKDKELYRLFNKNPLAFWRWRSYFFDKEYKIPYKNWEEIKKIRAEEKVKEITGCPIEF